MNYLGKMKVFIQVPTWQDGINPWKGDVDEVEPEDVGDLAQERHGVEEDEPGAEDEGLHADQEAEGDHVQEGAVHEAGGHLGDAGQGAHPQGDESVVVYNGGYD